MYCPTCNYTIETTIRFCPHCGTELTSTVQSHSTTFRASNNPLLVLKPTFIGWVTALSMIPIAFFFALWGGIFFGVFSTFAFFALNLNIHFSYPIVFFALFFLLFIPLIAYFSKKKTYQKTEYRFFHDRLEYYEGFFNIHEKSISYKNITEAHLRKGIIQRRYDIGTIILATPATAVYTGGWQSTHRGMPSSGIKIHDVKNPEENYRKIKELISRK